MSSVYDKYGDIIDKTWDPGDEFFLKHPRMDLEQRAKIFAPFAALRGFGEKIQEEHAKTTRSFRRELSEEEIGNLSDKLLQVKKGMPLSLSFFLPDDGENDLGYEAEASGIVEKIDPLSRILRVKVEGKEEDIIVPFYDLYDISGEGIIGIDDFLGVDLQE